MTDSFSLTRNVLSGDYFANLLDKASQQNDHFMIIKKLLAEEIEHPIPVDQIVSSYVDDKQLIVYCASSIWASRIRLELSLHLPKLQQQYPEMFSHTNILVRLK